MKINTKFDIGDEVYFMYNDKVQIGHVWSIRIGISGPNWISEKYTMQEHGGSTYAPRFTPNQLFRTKQELMESL